MQEVRFPSGPNRLHGQFHEADGSVRGAILLVHGFNSSLDEFGQAPAWLAAAGYHTLAFDQSGFGRSEGDVGRTDLERARADIASASAELRRMSGKRTPMGVIGHSLGGAYTAAALAPGTHFSAAVLAQPLNRMFDEMNVFARAMYHVIGRRAERRSARGLPPGRVPYKSRSDKLFVSREAQAAAGRPDFLLRHVYLANYRGALGTAGAEWARGAQVPTLVVVSPFDRVVKPANSMKVYDALPEPKALLEHKGGHSCFRDLDGRFIVDGCIAWFHQHMGGR